MTREGTVWQKDLLLEASSLFTAEATTSALGPDALMNYFERRGVPPGAFHLFEKARDCR